MGRRQGGQPLSAQATYAPIVLRAPTPDDTSFIYNSWLRSYRQNSAYASSIPRTVYFKGQKALVARLLRVSAVLVAANPECPEQIYGYGVYQPSTAGVAIVHFIYVKQSFRLFHVGSQILWAIRVAAGQDAATPVAATHMTAPAQKTGWRLVFNPYLMEVGDEQSF